MSPGRWRECIAATKTNVRARSSGERKDLYRAAMPRFTCPGSSTVRPVVMGNGYPHMDVSTRRSTLRDLAGCRLPGQATVQFGEGCVIVPYP